MVQHDFADVAFGQRLLSEGRVSWWEESDFLAQLRGSLPKQDLFGRLCEELQPFREQILKDLGPRVKEETSGAFLSARQGQKKGVEVASRPNQGRSLVTTRHLERGFVVIREYPLAKVLLDLENRSGLPGLKLHPETRLALQLWNAERKGDKRIEAAKDLLDHGGNDASALKMRALLAACCTLCVDVGISRNAACESLFHWLGCVRVNAVAVTALVEAEGEEMQQAKVALALYPDLARSVNHSCRPNGVLRFDAKDSHVELVVSAGVDAGEEVTISYGPTSSTMPRSQRLGILMAQYGFECHCTACGGTSVDEDFQWKRKAKMLDERARAAVARAAWQEAVIACSASIAMLRQGFRDGDVELAREECKLAGLTLRAGDAVKARELWSSSADVLRCLVMPADPDLREAEEMLRQLPASPVQKASSSSAAFATASSKSEVAAAIGGLCRAIETATAAKKKAPSQPASTVTDSFAGAIYGLENLNLNASEKAKLMQAMAAEGVTHGVRKKDLASDTEEEEEKQLGDYTSKKACFIHVPPGDFTRKEQLCEMLEEDPDFEAPSSTAAGIVSEGEQPEPGVMRALEKYKWSSVTSSFIPGYNPGGGSDDLWRLFFDDNFLTSQKEPNRAARALLGYKSLGSFVVSCVNRGTGIERPISRKEVADLIMRRQQGGDAERISREHEDQRARMEAFSKLGGQTVELDG